MTEFKQIVEQCAAELEQQLHDNKPQELVLKLSCKQYILRIDQLLYLKPEPKEESAQDAPSGSRQMSEEEKKKLLEEDEMIGQF